MERLRHFQRAALFRLAVADLLLRLPVMQVSDRLTDVAELIIEHALQLAWQQLTPAARRAMCGEGAARRDGAHRVIGYGKLGGMELGYAPISIWCSCTIPAARSRRPRARARIDNQVFFVRFAQRLVHLLTVHSRAGRLYEVDMRLRPSGKAGLLITSIAGVRGVPAPRGLDLGASGAAARARRGRGGARCVRVRGGAARDAGARVRRETAARGRAPHAQPACAASCRAPPPGEFDLKQDAGGIARYRVPGAVLGAAAGRGTTRRWPTSPTPFASSSRWPRRTWYPRRWSTYLTGIYRTYRTRLHHRALDGRGAVVAAGEFMSERAAVTAIWDQVMGV